MVFSARCSGIPRCCPRSPPRTSRAACAAGGPEHGGDRGESRRGRRKWERKGLSGSAAMHAVPGGGEGRGGPSAAGRGCGPGPLILLHPGWVHTGSVSPGEGNICRAREEFAGQGKMGVCSVLGARAAPGITPAAGGAGLGAVWGSPWGRGSRLLSPSPPATQPTWAARPLCPPPPFPPGF